ncbi:DNA-binding response regulator [Actinoalloteichus sp. AHMU CJ021]|uniref:DNA-binding response regulator, OmpR family, contains REC and winged-helix (WHTH) domain n=1 Tax=Actinoalloteichus caeruleus DSM 43889 TaxID=1120930 RepID=A0ABT1JNZ7_ACTCY|nr:response regulator transcription factor [Actinoalloteichus caeruleus]AUS79587.1 DNA-binding response regulator [Actinoalloteichus sp. AHMU CJ021]MCP2333884.1 DNA-binding response regulator, OmpR family, contains REC and winged-helix (wHTH) domain [Actinoalloteichus caeruleus DSM 43889]
MARLLLVEDDDALAEALTLALRGLGHEVVAAGGGEGGLELLALGESVDLLLVDVMLPGIDGFEVCRRVRARSTLPIILLTARGDPIDVVAGLECGADDYVVKPVEPRVLDARIKAVLRRSASAPGQEVVRIGEVAIDRTAMVVTREGHEVNLTSTELRLLLEFADHSGQVLTRQVLLRRVWDYGYVGDSRIVDAAVSRLRSKIERDPANPELVLTVRGLGYRLAKP